MLQKMQYLYGKDYLGTHAIPIYWEVLNQVGNSDLAVQKRLLKNVLPLFKPRSVIVLGDREFHVPPLAQWLQSKSVYFALRQNCRFADFP